MTPEQLTVILAWQSAQTELKVAKEAEMALRKRIAEMCFPIPHEGANRIAISDKESLTLTHKFTRSIDEAVLASTLERLPNGFGDSLIRTKPTLILKAYKALPEHQRRIFDDCIVTKPSAPTITIAASKE